MTALYSHFGQHPATLPFRIRLPDGTTRTDPATFSPDEIAAAGFVPAPPPPTFDLASQQLGWDGDGWTLEPLPALEPAFPPLTGRQIKRVLRMIGITADMVDAQIIDLAAQQIAAAQDIGDEAARLAAIAEIELERDFALIDWQDAREYHRDYPLLNDIAAAFELPEEQVDTLWLWAAEL